ncbi:hypothetical protein GC169_08420 [bacterium]|nr:hypothetical protein [bacterium]
MADDTSLGGLLAGWIAFMADGVRGLAPAAGAPGWLIDALASAPDWAIVIPAPLVLFVGLLWGLSVVGRGRRAAAGFAADVQAGAATLSGGRVAMPPAPATDRHVEAIDRDRQEQDREAEARVKATVASEVAAAKREILDALREREADHPSAAPASPEAQAQFAESVAEDPDLADAKARIVARDFDGATAAVREVAEREAARRKQSSVREAQLWRDLGLLEAGRSVANAIDAYEKARALEGDDVWTLIYLSRLYRAKGDLPRAGEAAGAALDAATNQRDRSVANNELGDVAVARNDSEGALNAYREGLEIARALHAADRSNAVLQRDLIVSHVKLGEVSGDPKWTEAALEIALGMQAKGILAPVDAWMVPELQKLVAAARG